MSTILQNYSQERDNKIYEDKNVKANNDIKNKPQLLHEDMIKTEEEIIDELINRKISNNIYTLKFDNKTKNTVTKTIPYKIKLRRFCYSVDSKKPRKMKLKDWLNDNIENTSKIEEDIEDLIIEIFVNRFNSYPEKDCPLSENALESKKQIDIYCSKFSEFSIYLLYVIYQKFYTFFEYLTKKINLKTLKVAEINKIKEILFLTGVDIKIVFKKAFEKTNNFNLSSILIIMLDEYLVKETKITICKEIKNSPFYKEKENFEKYLKIVKQNIYFFELDIEEESNQIYSKFFENNYVNEEENEKNNENKNEKNEDITDNESTEIDKEEENNKINKHNDKENKRNNNISNGDNKANNNKNIEKTNENNNSIQNLNIDDLVNYINDSDNKNSKKKKKKKKKSKKQEKNKIEQDKKIENDYVEEDLIYINYKRALEEYTKNVLNTTKVKPKYSEEFLKKISILAQ